MSFTSTATASKWDKSVENMWQRQTEHHSMNAYSARGNKTQTYSLHRYDLIVNGFGLCPVVVHNDYMILDRHTHNTFTGIAILF
jgi:hypothetical protein